MVEVTGEAVSAAVMEAAWRAAATGAAAAATAVRMVSPLVGAQWFSSVKLSFFLTHDDTCITPG